MRKGISVFCFMGFSVFFGISSVFPLFQKVSGIEKTSISKIVISPFPDGKIYAAASSTVFVSRDGGKTWEKAFTGRGEDVTDLCFDTDTADNLYIATTSGVYLLSRNITENIGRLPPDVAILCITYYHGYCYIGTTAGLYILDPSLKRIKPVRGKWGDESVYSVEGRGRRIYIVALSGIYASKDGTDFVKKFTLKGVDEEDNNEAEDDQRMCLPHHIHVDIFNPHLVYAATSCGLFISYDEGNRWDRFSSILPVHLDIRRVINNPLERTTVYLATDRGIYVLNIKGKTVHTLFEGLGTRNVYDLAFTQQGELFAATEKGIFVQLPYGTPHEEITMEEIMKGEPPIEKVQEAALYYNEVHPDKIRHWRRALKYRALLPEVSLDYDKSVYGTAGSSTYDGKSYVGPRDWGISLSWDAGDLVWNSYEDDVDTRSRLVTQLRINILDDVNTTYFERLRLKQKLAGDNYSSTASRIKDLLRFKELTAILDGYTGGYISRYYKENASGYNR